MSETAPSSDSKVPANLGLILALVIFAAALLLRTVGLGWGLKNDIRQQSLHPDEGVVYAYSQAIQPTQLQFDPGFYNYGTLYLTVVRVTSDVVAGYTGAPDPKNEETVWAYVSRVHFAGRLISALAGAAMALVVFLIARRFLPLFGASAAGLLVAVAPGHVVHSRFQTVDILAAFLLTASFALALRLSPATAISEPEATDKDLAKWALLSGIFAGLSAGTKYTGILAILTLLIVAWTCRRQTAPKLMAMGFGAALLAFALTTPGAFLNTAKFMEDFRYEMAHTSTGHGIVFAGTGSGFIYHLFINLFLGLGPLLVLLGLGGLGLSVARKQPWALASVVLFLLYYILIGRAEVKFLRYTFPLYPMLALGFGYLMSECHQRTRAWKVGVALGIFGLGGFPFGGLSTTAMMTNWMASEDPRDAAARYLKTEAAGKTVGFVSDPWFYSPPVYPLTGQARVMPGTTMIAIAGPGLRRKAIDATENPKVLMSLPEGEEPFAWDVRLLDQKPDFVVFSSFEYADPMRLRGVPGLPADIQVQVDRCKAFGDRLTQEYEEVRVWGGDGALLVHDLQYVQPAVYVWRRKPAP